MIDPNFYDLAIGAIGTLHYNVDATKHMSEEEKQSYVNRASNERMRAFMMNMTYGMNGNGPTDPQEAFNKSRADSWGDLEDGIMGLETKQISIQIGQKESYDAIIKIESKEDFKCWLNPMFVELIKEQFIK